jgi:nucleoside diphosphate kinase
MVRFESTRVEHDVIGKIADRARKDGLKIVTKMSLSMDLDATNTTNPLDLEKLLYFPPFDFAHDIYGIMANLNRETGELENCFLPRCSR